MKTEREKSSESKRVVLIRTQSFPDCRHSNIKGEPGLSIMMQEILRIVGLGSPGRRRWGAVSHIRIHNLRHKFSAEYDFARR